MGTIQKLWCLVWQDGRYVLLPWLILCIVLIIITSILHIGVPILFKNLINTLNLMLTYEVVIFMILIYVVMQFVAKVIENIRFYFYARLEQKCYKLLQLKTFTHLHSLPLKHIIQKDLGSLINIVSSGTNAFNSTNRAIFESLSPLVIELVGAFLLIAYLYSLELFIIIFSLFVIYSLVIILGNEWVRKYREKFRDISIQNSGFYTDTLVNFETVKYFTLEHYFKNKYQSLLIKYEEAVYQAINRSIIVSIVGAVVILLALLPSLIITSKKVMSQELSIGDFVLIHSYLLMFVKPLQGIGFLYRNIKENSIQSEKILELLSIPPENINLDDGIEFPLNSSIEFKNVNFSYDNKCLIKNMSFYIPNRSRIAIIGPSGAGKSTICKLLLRLYQPQQGNIYIGKQSIQDIKLSSLRKNIAIIPQEVMLFNGTIAENISFGSENATQEKVTEAAKLASIHEFILSLPKGYNTRVGERGIKLSGGEKQRIGIARAIIRKPAIYIFDEATSFLDKKIEAEIQKTLFTISKNTTSIFISHKLYDISGSDNIIVVKDGTIIEQGQHKSLYMQGGYYASVTNKV